MADTPDKSDFLHQLQKILNPSALFNTKNRPLEKIAPLLPERVILQNEKYHGLLSPSAKSDVVKHHLSHGHVRADMQIGFQGA